MYWNTCPVNPQEAVWYLFKIATIGSIFFHKILKWVFVFHPFIQKRIWEVKHCCCPIRFTISSSLCQKRLMGFMSGPWVGPVKSIGLCSVHTYTHTYTCAHAHAYTHTRAPNHICWMHTVDLNVHWPSSVYRLTVLRLNALSARQKFLLADKHFSALPPLPFAISLNRKLTDSLQKLADRSFSHGQRNLQTLTPSRI